MSQTFPPRQQSPRDEDKGGRAEPRRFPAPVPSAIKACAPEQKPADIPVECRESRLRREPRVTSQEKKSAPEARPEIRQSGRRFQYRTKCFASAAASEYG